MQWLTSKAQDKAVVRLGGGGPTRVSTMEDVSTWCVMFPEFVTLKEQLRYAEP